MAGAVGSWQRAVGKGSGQGQWARAVGSWQMAVGEGSGQLAVGKGLDSRIWVKEFQGFRVSSFPFQRVFVKFGDLGEGRCLAFLVSRWQVADSVSVVEIDEIRLHNLKLLVSGWSKRPG